MDDPLIGTIVLFAGSYAPYGWAFCDGKVLSISQYTALFSILGTQYGGDGRTNFALPNLPTVKDVDGQGESRYIVALQGLYPMRND